MPDLAELQLKITGDDKIISSLDKIETKAKNIQRATDKLDFGKKKLSATEQAMQKQQKQMQKIADSYKHADAAAQNYWNEIRKNASKVEQDLKQLKKANVAAFDSEDIRLYKRSLSSAETQLRKLKGYIPDEEFNKLQREISDSRRELNRLNDTSKTAVSGFSKLQKGMAGLAAGGAVAAGIAYMGKRLLDTTAQLKQSAAQANMTVESFQKMEYVASQYNITQSAMIDGLKELNLRADEFAVTGKGPAAEAFERLGYTQKELNNQLNDTPQLLSNVIKRMQDLDNAAQIRIADEIFGGQGGEQFVDMMNDGSKSVAELAKEAERLGLVMDKSLVDSAVEANRALDTTFRILKTNLTRALVAATPQIISIANAFGHWATNIANVLDKMMPMQLASIDELDRRIEGIQQKIENLSKADKSGPYLGRGQGYGHGTDPAAEVEELREELEKLNDARDEQQKRFEAYQKALQAGNRTYKELNGNVEENTEANNRNTESLANWLTQQEMLTSAVTMWDTFRGRNDNICASTNTGQSKSSDRHRKQHGKHIYKDSAISTYRGDDHNEWQGSYATEVCLSVAA